MKFRFAKQSPLENARRIAFEQLAAASDWLTGPDNRDKAAHEARKCLKRLRTLLRLSRGVLSNDAFQRENQAFRDIGRALAPIRDNAAELETLERLSKLFGGKISPAAIKAVRRDLSVGRVQPDVEAIFAMAISELDAARTRLAEWEITGDDFAVFEKGLRWIYRRGARALDIARRSPSDGAFHEWRKREKDLWHCARLFQPFCPALIAPYQRALHRLSENLGFAHDLAVFRQALSARPSSEAELFRDLAARQSAKIQRSTIRLGAFVYAEKPGAFARRFRAYWNVWKNKAS